MKTTGWIICFGACLFLTACLDVELCYNDRHPHRTALDFRYIWDEEYKIFRTDSMRVVAIRPSNLLRYEFRVTSAERGNKGVMLAPLSERQAENGETKPVSVNDCLCIRSGNYKFVTYTSDTRLVNDGFGIEPIGSGEDMATDFSDICVSYKPVKVDDPQLTARFGSWKTYNIYTDYVSGLVRPIFFDHVDYLDVPVVQEADDSLTVVFHPYPVTQHVSFVFSMEKENGIVVDSVTAEISGVPSKIALATGLVDAKKSYKMLFKASYPSLATYEDSLRATSLECQGEVDVIGIVRSVNEKMQTGPGILQLAVYSHVRKETDGLIPSRTFQKIFYAGINMFHTLSDNPSLKWNDAEGMYRQVNHEVGLHIGSVLKLSKDKVLNGGSGETGFDEWFEGDKIDLDI